MHKFFAIFLLALFSIACTKNPAKRVPVPFQGTAMTMEYRILIGHSLTVSEQRDVQRIIREAFFEIDTIYNRWNPDSEISKINASTADQEWVISPELDHLLEITDNVVKLTHGRFDPTIEPIQQLWKNYLAEGKTPPKKAIENLAEAIGWDKIVRSNGVLKKKHSLTALDLGGIAKGYAVDIILERLLYQGWSNLYVEWGGEIRANGHHPAERPWLVGIRQINSQDQTMVTINLENQALATSGDYWQNWVSELEDGKKTVFTHIYDKNRLVPLTISPQSIASASVMASNCALADGLATALMLFPTKEEALVWSKEIQNKYPEIKFWIVTRE